MFGDKYENIVIVDTGDRTEYKAGDMAVRTTFIIFVVRNDTLGVNSKQNIYFKKGCKTNGRKEYENRGNKT